MKKLIKGNKAPNFKAATVYGEIFDLQKALQGDEKIFLAFHRYASCPICNFSLRQFQQGYNELLDKGVRYVPIFHSGIESMRESYPEAPPFEIIADPNMNLYKDYGLKPSITAFLHPKALADGLKAFNSIIQPGYVFRLAPEKTLLTKPADFLIGNDGEILHARYGVSLGDSMTLKNLLELIP
jgi:peroxiredoxin